MSWPEKGKRMKEPVGLQISFMWRSQSKCQRLEVYVMVGKGWQLPIVLSCDRNLLLSYVRDSENLSSGPQASDKCSLKGRRRIKRKSRKTLKSTASLLRCWLSRARCPRTPPSEHPTCLISTTLSSNTPASI